jgi:hypothetical protein
MIECSMKKYNIIPIFALSLFLVYSSLAASIQEQRKNLKHGFLGASLGYSMYLVDPDIDLGLYGPTLEMKWVRLKEAAYHVWGFESSEKGFSFLYSRASNGRIDVNDVTLAYGRRYNFRSGRVHPYAGFDTGLSWLFSGKKVDEQTGYTLDTGIRPCLNINTGAYLDVRSHLKLGLNLKYSFSVKRIRLHNPFARHKHEDIFHYLSLGFDVKLGSRGIRSLVTKMGIGPDFVALDNPTFVSSEDAVHLHEDDEVVGIELNGQSKAYSLKPAAHHHIIHDELGGMPILVTFCPLTYTAMIFDRTLDGEVLEFDVEGGLIDNNMIMIDRETESKWVQITGEAISGKMKGKKLRLLHALHTTWETWKSLHPDTLVLSHDTGFDYNYEEYPFGKSYMEYRENWRIMFPLSYEDERFHPKEVFLVVELGDTFEAYRLSNMKNREVINDVIDEKPILILYDRERQLASAFSRVANGKTLEFELDESSNSYIKDRSATCRWDFEGTAHNGENLTPIPSFKAYWFAWAAFHPDTLVYEN